MSNAVTLGGFMLSMPDGWFDVTADLPEGTPITLAKPEGIGALQLTVATYRDGALPAIDIAALENLLMQFADSKGLGAPSNVCAALGLHPYVFGDFGNQEELIRVWYLSNGKDVALITYVTQQPNGSEAKDELNSATTMIQSMDFV